MQLFHAAQLLWLLAVSLQFIERLCEILFAYIYIINMCIYACNWYLFVYIFFGFAVILLVAQFVCLWFELHFVRFAFMRESRKNACDLHSSSSLLLSPLWLLLLQQELHWMAASAFDSVSTVTIINSKKKKNYKNNKKWS